MICFNDNEFGIYYCTKIGNNTM